MQNADRKRKRELDRETNYDSRSVANSLALIINNKEFSGTTLSRHGSEIDVKKMQELLDGLGYTVQVNENLTAMDMLKTAKTFAQLKNHDKGDSCVVVVMSHGGHNMLIGTDNDKISNDEFFDCFNTNNAPLLYGKPKLFFIQACQGELVDDPRKAITTLSDGSSTSREINKDKTDKTSSLPKPIYGDMVKAFATTPGYKAHRHPTEGSIYILAICDVFRDFANTLHIHDLLTKVTNRVHEYSYGYSTAYCIQTPEFRSSLKKNFFFKNYYTAENCDFSPPIEEGNSVDEHSALDVREPEPESTPKKRQNFMLPSNG